MKISMELQDLEEAFVNGTLVEFVREQIKEGAEKRSALSKKRSEAAIKQHRLSQSLSVQNGTFAVQGAPQDAPQNGTFADQATTVSPPYISPSDSIYNTSPNKSIISLTESYKRSREILDSIPDAEHIISIWNDNKGPKLPEVPWKGLYKNYSLVLEMAKIQDSVEGNLDLWCKMVVCFSQDLFNLEKTHGLGTLCRTLEKWKTKAMLLTNTNDNNSPVITDWELEEF